MLLAACGHSPCASGLTSIRKSPVRSPALQATPSTSTDSRYWSAGKAGVGVNSSIGVSATKHKERERLRRCGKKQGGQERPGAWQNPSASSEGTRRRGEARPQRRNRALLTGFHRHWAAGRSQQPAPRTRKGAVAFPREALLLGTPPPGRAVAQPPREQHPRGRASPTT